MKNELAIYRDYYLQALILETLSVHGEIAVDELLPKLLVKIRKNKTAYWSITQPDVKAQVRYLNSLGLIQVRGESMSIEERGIEALINGSFQNMASAAFFNYRNIHTSTIALWVSIGAAIIALISAFVKNSS